MKRLIMLVLMTFGCAAMAAAQSQQELIEMYRNGMLSQSQIDNLHTHQHQSVVRTRQTTAVVTADANNEQNIESVSVEQSIEVVIPTSRS